VLSEAGLPSHFEANAGDQIARLCQLPDDGLDLEKFLDEIEKNVLLQALDRCGGVRKHAAQLLKVSFRSLRYRLDKLGLS
jgi:two-component system response regulator PilR (NtrC family)